MLGRKTSGSYEQEYVRTGEGQASQKRQKDSSKHVGEPSKGGCSRPRDMICRQHEFVMGHHRDPTVRYLAIALLTYRRLRPSSRCSQSSVNTKIFSLDVSSAKKRSKHSVSKHLSDALDYSLPKNSDILRTPWRRARRVAKALRPRSYNQRPRSYNRPAARVFGEFPAHRPRRTNQTKNRDARAQKSARNQRSRRSR